MESAQQGKGGKDNLLITLLILAIVVSVVGTYVSIAKLKGTLPLGITGMVTGTAQANVTKSVSISLTVSTVDFGNKVVTNADDTTDNVPPPFIVQNDGNVRVNVTTTATALFTGDTGNASDYQFKCSNKESVCGPLSITTLTAFNTTAIYNFTMVNLTSGNINDSMNLEISVVVPDDEVAGAKSSTVTFTGSSYDGSQ